jgi:hypothetical protein
MAAQSGKRQMVERASPLERHVQTIIQVVLVALLLWSGQSIIELKDKMARVETQLIAIQQAQISASTDRYPKSQAILELTQIRQILNQQERDNEREHQVLREWLRSLRDRVIELEGFARTTGFRPSRRIDPIDSGPSK